MEITVGLKGEASTLVEKDTQLYTKVTSDKLPVGLIVLGVLAFVIALVGLLLNTAITEFAEHRRRSKAIMCRLAAVPHISQESVPKSRFLTASPRGKR